MTAIQAAIHAEDLRKSYGGFEAVRGVSLQVSQGEVLALLGRNGAGKTTTIELLAGFRRPDSGRVRVLGLDPAAEPARVRRRIGVMLQEAGFFPDLTVAQTVESWCAFTPAARPAHEALELAGLLPKAATRVRGLSGGERRRLDLALAVLGRPEVLFLDEPTAGMDPEGRRDTWQVVRELAGAGTAVVLTTHYLDEAQQLAGSLVIMDAGRVVAAGGMAETLAAGSGRVSFEAPPGLGPGDLPLPAAVEGGRVVCRVEDPDLAAQTLLGWAAARGLRLRGLEVRRASLEELFLEVGADAGIADGQRGEGARHGA
ncbi:ABC transporter ATP-binding protein [Thermoactinospora rubra]|uniref:ABC transporter ATP-binding protein n=1 Tax=Thermoactinospora rubra TaxID=1088767 RepID=UPI000A101884|nr:ABC transporter ATP-binding protein [Thermoactinospora rubra]